MVNQNDFWFMQGSRSNGIANKDIGMDTIRQNDFVSPIVLTMSSVRVWAKKTELKTEVKSYFWYFLSHWCMVHVVIFF